LGWLAVLAVGASACGGSQSGSSNATGAGAATTPVEHRATRDETVTKTSALLHPATDPAVQAERKMEAKERASEEEVRPYAGLGATKSQFLANNYAFMPNNEPREPPKGSQKDVIERLSPSGRVTKYLSVFYFEPPPSNREKLFLVDGIHLPDDKQVVRETSTCTDWRSAILQELVGKPYAEATTVSEVPSVTIEAVSVPGC
jgi:hypothetical protein